LKQRRLSRDIVGVFSTRAVWTILGAIGGIILARVLGPHDRGILALVIALPATTVTLVKLGITQANVYFINRERHASVQVASNAAALAIVMGVFASGLVWLARDGLLATILRGVPPWALALALLRVPFMLLDDYLYGVLQAVGEFRIYNRRLLVSEVLRLTLIVVALMVFNLGLFAAVLIQTVVNVFNLTWLVVTMRRTIPFTLRVDPALLRRQLGFGAKSYVQTVTSHMLLRTDIYLVSYFLGPAQTAFYSLALRFTEMVLELPQAVGLVLYPRLASLPDDEIHRLTAQACRRTLLITSLCSLSIILAGPWVIVLWYGAAYAPAGAPLFWASIGALAMSVFVILTRDFTSRNRQTVNIAAGLPALVLNVSLNFFLIPAMGIVGAALATAIAYSTAVVILLIFYLPRARLSLFDVLVAKREDLRFFRDATRRAALRFKARSAGTGS
jgi:O-antigen/teichoic acid export membrane protein